MADYTPYRVDVITPEGPAFQGEAQIVVVPGTAAIWACWRTTRR